MTSQNRHDLPPGTRPRRPATRRRIWWLAVLLIGSMAILAACSAPGGSEPARDPSPAAEDTSAAGPESPDSEPPAAPGGRTRRSGQSLESDELVGLGELGLLPSLLQTFSTSGIHCDFDDALSTCQ